MPQNGLIQSIDSFPNAYGEGIQLNLTTAATTALSSAGSIQVMFDGMSLPDGSRVEGFSQNLQLNNTGASDTAPATAGMGKLIIGLADNATSNQAKPSCLYNGGELRDTSNIPAKSFTQVVTNSSSLANDQTSNPPSRDPLPSTPMAAPSNSTSQNPSGKDSLTSFDTDQFKPLSMALSKQLVPSPSI